MVVSAAEIMLRIKASGIPDEPDDYERTDLVYANRPGRPPAGWDVICACGCGTRAGSSGLCRAAYERARRAKRKRT